MTNPRSVIPNDNLTAYERWELPLVDEARGKPSAAAPPMAASPEPATASLDGQNTFDLGDDALLQQVSLPTADELESIRQAAYEEGLSQGYGEGLKKGEAVILQKQKLLEQQSRQLLTVLRALQQPMAKVDDEVEAELLSLVLAVSRQVIYCQMRLEPKEILAAVREGLSALPSHARKVRLYLHPQDLQFLREQMQLLGEDFHGELLSDESLKAGGCRLTSDISTVDMDLEQRIALIFGRLQQEPDVTEVES